MKISRKKVRNLHNLGYGTHEIARRLGCAPATVTKIKKELSIELRQVGKKPTSDEVKVCKLAWGYRRTKEYEKIAEKINKLLARLGEKDD